MDERQILEYVIVISVLHSSVHNEIKQSSCLLEEEPAALFPVLWPVISDPLSLAGLRCVLTDAPCAPDVPVFSVFSLKSNVLQY